MGLMCQYRLSFLTMLPLAIMVMTVTITCVSTEEKESLELNTAVIPAWVDMIKPIFASQSINRFTLQLGKPRSDYDKITTALELLRDNNIHAVVGPYDDSIALATEALDIAYIATSPVSSTKLNATFQILPSLDDFSQAMLDLVGHYKWRKVSLYFDDDQGISIVEKLLTNHELMIKSWKLDEQATEAQVKDHLVHMRTIAMRRSIVFCSMKNIHVLLETARSLAMLSTPYEWFFYDPGDQLADLFAKYPDIHVNFTIFSLLPFNTSEKQARLHDDGFNYTLAVDSIAILAEAFKNVDHNDSIKQARKTIVNSIAQISHEGKTGHIEFNNQLRRTNFSIFLTELSGFDEHSIGKWVAMEDPGLFLPRLDMYKRKNFFNRSSPFPLTGRTAKVVTILEKPFTMFKRDHRVRQGNDKFEGFAVDLIQKVADMLNFEFELYLVNDGKFGTKQISDGTWNGMMGELLIGNATMAVAPLSINSDREAAVDFTKPFMTRYISVLMKVPKSTTAYFEFLNPLHPIVWFCTLGAFVFVSIILYILERVGTVNKKEYPAITFRESFWFVFGSLLQGSTDASPSTLPGRILTSSWWFFALILISSYTANLAAFLTVKKINTPIKSVADLASQTRIKYGTVEDSGIMSFFKNTNIEHFSKMWAQMSEIEPSSMVIDTEDGFKKVKDGDYAFFWDTTVNKYKTIEDCDFMEVGPPFDPKGFGIAVPPGASYREELSMAILRLSDKGTVHELENRWWGQRNCPDLAKPSTDETSELQIENVAGVFFILLGGVAIAAIVCLGEYFAKQISKSVKKNEAACSLNHVPDLGSFESVQNCTDRHQERATKLNDKERESFL